MKLKVKFIRTVLLSAMLVVGIATPCEAQRRSRKAKKPKATPVNTSKEQAVIDDGLFRLRLNDGTLIVVEDAWETPQGVWYRQGGMSHLVTKDRIKGIERPASVTAPAPITNAEPEPSQMEPPLWIYLVGGARVEVDTVSESAAGVWYERGSLSIFLDRSRIDRIERESSETLAHAKERRWSTGSGRLDSLIKQNGARFGVDPYLIFLVMEQESQFNSRAVSPKGAQGLMQLMPGTAARFGVRRPFDPAQNIAGGTRYLRLLLDRFKGRVDLVLASYNAGEGAVAKFGNRVPPYAETRNYVKRISYRYRKAEKPSASTPPPNGGGQ